MNSRLLDLQTDTHLLPDTLPTALGSTALSFQPQKVTLYINGFFLPVWYNKLGIIHCTNLEVSCYNLKKIVFFVGISFCITLTNSVDPDEMLKNAVFYLGVHYL